MLKRPGLLCISTKNAVAILPVLSWKYVNGTLWRSSIVPLHILKKDALGHLYPSPENTSKTAENGPVVLKTLQVNEAAPDNQALAYTKVVLPEGP